MRKQTVIKLVVLLGALCCVFFWSCSKAEKNEKTIAAMATDVGGLGDKSFNDGCYEGLKTAEKELGVEVRMIQSNQQTDYIPNLTGLADDGADIVFGVGFLMADALVETAKNNPDTFFGGIDVSVDSSLNLPNLLGIQFKEQEGGYLAGIVAGYLTREYASVSDKLNDKNVVGVVLGMDIPPCERYQAGFYAGVKSVNPDCQVLSVVVGDFADQAKGKEAAIALAEKGADIVFQVAGLTGLGVINGAKEKNILAIGVDVDQNWVAPETVITSAMKNVSRATFLTVEAAVGGKFQGGNRNFSIKDGGTGIAPFHSFESLIPEVVKAAVKDATDKLISGAVVPPASRTEAGYEG